MKIGNKLDSRGFTIVEVAVAIFMLVVAFMGVASTTVMVVNGNAISKMSTTASALASAKMEDLKSKSFTDANLAAGSHADAENPLQGFYTRSWSVTDVMDASGMGVSYKTISLTVTWNGQNSSRSMSLSTLKTNSS
ncbi:MAG TPA: hypothetical protein DCZ97_06650 [Syntrophus sp. (in: bacteria)]|nr:hypothetical protein [Syntrophus sp. (in: bacteria)]